MTQRVDLIVRNGTVVTPAGRGSLDIAATDGRIVAIAQRGRLALRASREVDAIGRHVLPGVIDGHVHFRDPGLTWKEDFRSGSLAAIMGGVTTVLDMPNTDPPTDSAAHAQRKLEAAAARAWCDFGLIGLVSAGNLGELRPMADAGQVVGFKAFLGGTVGDIPTPDDGSLLEAMAEVRSLGMRLGFHAENGQILVRAAARLRAAGRTDPLAHVESRPVLAELESIGRVGLFAEATGCPIHIFHLSSRQGLDAVGWWRRRGVDCTTEATPQHCFLGAEDMAQVGARLRINPPVRHRAEGHGAALLAGLATGQVTGIATDHAPHTREEKLHDDIWASLSGFAGVETSVRLFLTHAVHAGVMTLEQYARASSEGPARTWGLYPRKGAILVGSDADLTIVDLDVEDTIDEARLHGRSNLTPYEGQRTRGAAVGTVVRGVVAMENGEPMGSPAGRLVRRVAWQG
ncbi:MAG: dihydroorotase family protein [Chloroflexota bacterium]